MKKLLTLTLAGLLAVGLSGCGPYENTATPEKPAIYLYPEEKTQVTVTLDLDGTLTSTYPDYGEGWTVTAQPDGTLTDPETGRTYYCLFWEGIIDRQFALSTGFCVAGADTAAFLEDALARLGLTERESNEFIIYWLPRMEGNLYNLISFQDQILLVLRCSHAGMIRVDNEHSANRILGEVDRLVRGQDCMLLTQSTVPTSTNPHFAT